MHVVMCVCMNDVCCTYVMIPLSVMSQCPFRRKDRASREEVERRVREDAVAFSEKFSEPARMFCSQVSRQEGEGRGRGGGGRGGGR